MQAGQHCTRRATGVTTMLQSSCLLQAPKSTPRGWTTTPPCTMQQTTGTSRLVFAGLHGLFFLMIIFFFLQSFQAASCTDTKILGILLSFAADSYIAGGSSLRHSVGLFLCRRKAHPFWNRRRERGLASRSAPSFLAQVHQCCWVLSPFLPISVSATGLSLATGCSPA